MHHRKKKRSASLRGGKNLTSYNKRILGRSWVPPKVSSLHLAMLSLRLSLHKQNAAARYSCTCSVNV